MKKLRQRLYIIRYHLMRDDSDTLKPYGFPSLVWVNSFPDWEADVLSQIK